MLIIIDKKIPAEAKEKLKEYGELLELETNGIVYDSISGHPDIFFCHLGNSIVYAPNIPEKFLSLLQERGIKLFKGEIALGQKYPETAKYNAVFIEDTLYHNFRYTDSVITDSIGEADLTHINQGYARCSLIPLGNDNSITSDEGVKRTLERFGKNALYVNPEEIILPGKKHGFIGGCCGIFDKKVFLIGSLSHIQDGEKIKQFINEAGLEVVELYDGPMFDGGNIMFVK